MSGGAESAGMPTWTKVLIAIPLVLFGYLLLGAIGIAGFVMGDHGAGQRVEVTNACGVDVFVGYSFADDQARTSYNVILKDGQTTHAYSEAGISLRLAGGLWTEVDLATGGSIAVAGDACPRPATESDWETIVAARAPLLADAELISVTTMPADDWALAPSESELTTIVAKVPQDVAAEWDSTYGMQQYSMARDDLLEVLHDAAPEAKWIRSGLFNVEVTTPELNATAFVDPATGIVVVRVWDADPYADPYS